MNPAVEESVQITIVVPCCNSVILTASPLEIGNGETSLLEVIFSDPDGDTLNYNWGIATGFGTVTPVPNTAQAVFTAPVSGSGSTEIQVTVSDGNGGTDTESIIITVMEKTIGTVTWIDLEGGFWGILTDENLSLGPINLDETFNIEGNIRQLRFTLLNLTWVYSMICMS